MSFCIKKKNYKKLIHVILRILQVFEVFHFSVLVELSMIVLDYTLYFYGYVSLYNNSLCLCVCVCVCVCVAGQGWECQVTGKLCTTLRSLTR